MEAILLRWGFPSARMGSRLAFVPHLGGARRPKRCHETRLRLVRSWSRAAGRLLDVVQVCWFTGFLLAWDVNQQLERSKQ